MIGTKFGFDLDPEQPRRMGGLNSRPEHIKKAVEGSLKRLRTDAIDLYYPHHVDPRVPIEDVAGAVKVLIQQGKVKHLGLSEAPPEIVRLAHAVHPVAALQREYSLLELAVESEVLRTCEELGIGFVAWGPLARGFLTGRFDETTRIDRTDRRAIAAYFRPEALRANLPLLALLHQWARRKEATPVQFALVWLQAQKAWIVPIPGTTNPQHLVENLGAAAIRLTPDELSQIHAEVTKIKVQGVHSSGSARNGR